MNAPGHAPYRPPPTSPSPRWGHAALAARVMRGVHFALIPAALVASVLRTLGMSRLMSDPETGRSFFFATRVIAMVGLGASGIAGAYFLVRVLTLPAYVQSRKRALAPLVVGFVSGAWSLASPYASSALRTHLMESGAYSMASVAQPLQLVQSAVAALGLMLSGLVTAALFDGLATELRGRRLGWTYLLVIVSVLLHGLGIVADTVMGLARHTLGGDVIPLGFALAGTFAQGALHVGWATAYGRLADALSSQTAPENLAS